MSAYDKDGRKLEVGNTAVMVVRITGIHEGADEMSKNLEVQPVDLPKGVKAEDYAFFTNSSGVTRV